MFKSNIPILSAKKKPNRSKLSPTPSQELFIAGKGGGNLQWLSDMITNQSDLLFIVNTRRIRGVWRFYDTRGTGCQTVPNLASINFSGTNAMETGRLEIA